MKKGGIWGALCLAALLFFQFAYANALDLPLLERLVLEKTNRERSAHGLPPLLWDRKAEEAARGHSEEMGRLGYMDHHSPTEGRRTPTERVRKARSSAVINGENVFRHSASGDAETMAKTMLSWWMNSPGHRANILDPSFTHLGVGAREGNFQGSRMIFVTQTFLGLSATDLRLTFQGSTPGSVTMRMSGKLAGGGNFIITWKEPGGTKWVPVNAKSGLFDETFAVASDAGEVEMSLAKRSDGGVFYLTDTFRVNTVRGTVDPPPY